MDKEEEYWCDIRGYFVEADFCNNCTECAALAEEHWLADKLLREPFDD